MAGIGEDRVWRWAEGLERGIQIDFRIFVRKYGEKTLWMKYCSKHDA